MSIRVRWHNDDHRVLVVQFASRWTWNEFFRVKATFDNLLDDVSEPVNSIFVLPTDVILPPDSVRHGKRAFETMHPNLNHIVVAHPNVLIRTVYQMVSRQYPAINERITLAESQVQALQQLDTLSAP